MACHYRFATDEEFDRLVEEDGLLEWATYGGNRYGTPRADVEEHIARGDQVILEIDVQGGFQVREKMPSAHLVFVEPPSLEVLEKRLRGRGDRDGGGHRHAHGGGAGGAFPKMEYDVRLVNDRLGRSRARFDGLRRRTSRRDTRLNTQ